MGWRVACVMMRSVVGLLLVLCLASSQAALASGPNYRSAQNAFHRLPSDDRFVISMMLIASGHYNGMSTGDFNQRIFSGIVQFQSSIGAAQTGILDENQKRLLFEAGRNFLARLGMKAVAHPHTNARLHVPTKLVENLTATKRGLSFEGEEASLDYSFFPLEDATLSDLFTRLSAASSTREINYKVLRDRFFVVSGSSGQRAFYSRFDIGDKGVVGFTLSWVHGLVGGDGGRIAVLMSNLFNSRTLSQVATSTPSQFPLKEEEPVPDRSKHSGTGSGFLVSNQGHVVTNAHVVEGCKAVAIGGASPATVIAVDTANDLALVKAETTALMTGKPLNVSRKPLRLGDEIVAIGYPLKGLLGGINVTIGNVSALSGLGNDSARIQFTAPIQPGNSGGPLLDRAGGLTGVVSSKLNDLRMIASAGVVPQNVNFAIRKEMIVAFLSSQGMHLQEAPASPDLSAADIAEAARPSVFVVECK